MSEQYDPFATYIESDDFNLSLGKPADFPAEPPVIIRTEDTHTTTWDFLAALMLDMSFIGWLLVGAVIGVGVRIVGRCVQWVKGRGGVGY